MTHLQWPPVPDSVPDRGALTRPWSVNRDYSLIRYARPVRLTITPPSQRKIFSTNLWWSQDPVCRRLGLNALTCRLPPCRRQCFPYSNLAQNSRARRFSPFSPVSCTGIQDKQRSRSLFTARSHHYRTGVLLPTAWCAHAAKRYWFALLYFLHLFPFHALSLLLSSDLPCSLCIPFQLKSFPLPAFLFLRFAFSHLSVVCPPFPLLREFVETVNL